MSRLAYLAGPVDQAKGEWAEAKTEIEQELNVLGFDVFRPDLAFCAGPASAAIQTANDAVIDTAQAGVVCLPAGVPTLGTPVEVERMLARKIPVLVVTDLGKSVQLRSWESRGAYIANPGDSSLELGLLDLAARVTEQVSRPKIGESLRKAGDALRQMTRPGSLVFERVPSKWKGEVRAEGIDLLPRRSYGSDAGLDLVVAEDMLIDGYDFVDVPCGVKIDIPKGYWALITGRSSTLRKRGLFVSNGVIDEGWTGELFAGVQNLKGADTLVSAGDRIAQLILLPAPVVGFVPEWGRVPEKDRGERGFGSSGS